MCIRDRSTPQQGDNIKKENEKWSSPIPRDSYRLLLQIAGYSDRLLTHPSRQLKVQILLTMRKIFPMLATEHAMLLPQVAKSWDLIVQLTSVSYTHLDVYKRQSLNNGISSSTGLTFFKYGAYLTLSFNNLETVIFNSFNGMLYGLFSLNLFFFFVFYTNIY